MIGLDIFLLDILHQDSAMPLRIVVRVLKVSGLGAFLNVKTLTPHKKTHTFQLKIVLPQVEETVDLFLRI